MTAIANQKGLASPVHRTLWALCSQYANLALNIISGLVLIPFYLKSIDVPTYGAWLATGEILAWLTMVDPGLGSSVQQRVGLAFGANERDRTGAYAAAGLVAMTALGVVVSLLGIVLSTRAISWLRIPETVSQAALTNAFLVAVAGTFLTLLAYGPGAVCAGLQRVKWLGILNVSATIIGMATTVVMLLRGAGLMALAFGSVARGICHLAGCTSILVYSLRECEIRLKFRRWAFRELLGLSAYSYLSQLAGLLRSRSDSLLLTRFLGPTVAAQYALTRRLPALAFTVAERPSFSLMPALSQAAGTSDRSQIQRLIFPLLMGTLWLTGLCALLLISLNEAFVSIWVGKGLSAGPTVCFWLSLFIVLQVPTEVMVNVSMALGRFRETSLAVLAEAIVYGVALLIGIHFYGAAGAVLALWIGKVAVASWYFPRLWYRERLLDLGHGLKLLREFSLSAGIILGGWIAARGHVPTTWLGLVCSASLLTAGYSFLLFAGSSEFRGMLRRVLGRAGVLR